MMVARVRPDPTKVEAFGVDTPALIDRSLDSDGYVDVLAL